MRTILIAGLLTLNAAAAQAGEITVFAASSLKTALDRIAADWQTETGHVALVSYDSSAKLAKQIAEGAPADVFFSAAENWMDTLQDAGLIVPDSRVQILGNTLVLVAHGARSEPVGIEQAFDMANLILKEKIAMGQVDSVPAGQYGKGALVNLGLWDSVAPQVAEVENVRAALAMVGRGEAAFGIVYASDAVADDLAADEVSVVGTFPESSHTPITYPAAITTTADPLAADFMAYLQVDKASATFTELGFTVLP